MHNWPFWSSKNNSVANTVLNVSNTEFLFQHTITVSFVILFDGLSASNCTGELFKDCESTGLCSSLISEHFLDCGTADV